MTKQKKKQQQQQNPLLTIQRAANTIQCTVLAEMANVNTILDDEKRCTESLTVFFYFSFLFLRSKCLKTFENILRVEILLF